MDSQKHVSITSGTDPIESFLTAELLGKGCFVTVLDRLLFGGESIFLFC